MTLHPSRYPALDEDPAPLPIVSEAQKLAILHADVIYWRERALRAESALDVAHNHRPALPDVAPPKWPAGGDMLAGPRPRYYDATGLRR